MFIQSVFERNALCYWECVETKRPHKGDTNLIHLHCGNIFIYYFNKWSLCEQSKMLVSFLWGFWEQNIQRAHISCLLKVPTMYYNKQVSDFFLWSSSIVCATILYYMNNMYIKLYKILGNSVKCPFLPLRFNYNIKDVNIRWLKNPCEVSLGDDLVLLSAIFRSVSSKTVHIDS